MNNASEYTETPDMPIGLSPKTVEGETIHGAISTQSSIISRLEKVVAELDMALRPVSKRQDEARMENDKVVPEVISVREGIMENSMRISRTVDTISRMLRSLEI